MADKRKEILIIRRKLLIDQLKIMDLFAEDTIKYFGSQKAIEIRINEILDEILKIDKTINNKQ